MGYVLAGLLVVLIVAAAVAVLTLSSRRQGRRRGTASSDADYGGAPGNESAIWAAEPDTPLGDTAEHAGRQEDGRTVGGLEGGRQRRE